MGKKDSKLGHILKNAKTAAKIDAGKKAEALRAINDAAYETRIPVLHSKKQVLKKHLLYMDKTAILSQILIYAVLSAGVMCLGKRGLGKQEILMISMFLSGIMGVVSTMDICRMLFSDMAELSESCYYNLYQMTAFHMVYSGIISLAVLFAGILFVWGSWRTDLLQTGLYILVPFVFSECCCLKALLTEAGRKNPYIICGIGIFAALLCVGLSAVPHLYQVSATLFWGGAFILGILLLRAQVKKLFEEIEKGEILCIN